jgi:hypothetical protein
VAVISSPHPHTCVNLNTQTAPQLQAVSFHEVFQQILHSICKCHSCLAACSTHLILHDLLIQIIKYCEFIYYVLSPFSWYFLSFILVSDVLLSTLPKLTAVSCKTKLDSNASVTCQFRISTVRSVRLVCVNGSI